MPVRRVRTPTIQVMQDGLTKSLSGDDEYCTEVRTRPGPRSSPPKIRVPALKLVGHRRAAPHGSGVWTGTHRNGNGRRDHREAHRHTAVQSHDPERGGTSGSGAFDPSAALSSRAARHRQVLLLQSCGTVSWRVTE
jgi:hypothetical protein